MSSKRVEQSTNVSKNEEDATCLEKWEKTTECMRRPLLKVLVGMSRFAARKPELTIISVIILSFFMIVVGFKTNFYLETDFAVLWSPSNSVTTKHDKWVREDSGFVERTRRIVGIVYSEGGEDVGTLDGMEKMFEIADLIRGLEGYDELCGEETADLCRITSPTGFWDDHSHTAYKESSLLTDDDVKKALSSFLFADGEFVNRNLIVGAPKPDVDFDDFQKFVDREKAKAAAEFFNVFQSGNVSGIDQDALLAEGLKKAAEEFELTFVKSLLFTFNIPERSDYVKKAEEFEKIVVEALLALNDKWDDHSISATTKSGNSNEIVRGIMKDIPLMVGAFLLMTLFCSYSLSKNHRVESQGILGVGAVFTIGMSLLSGYGLLFLLGVPLSSLSYLFPYGMLGFGLDDTFIITGAFKRTDPEKDVVERVVETIESVGMSISVSTITTVVAYLLGGTSKMPGVRWFCFYASPVILIDFIYQITFFIAILVLDDRRIKAKRLDCLICIKSTKEDNEIITAAEESERQKKLISNRIMFNYSKILLKPPVKAFVLILFSAMFGGFAYIASGITEGLDARDLLPPDSFVRNYFDNLETYTTGAQEIYSLSRVYFRDVDVSDEYVQDQMTDFVDDLVDMSHISNHPLTFWLRDFNAYLGLNQTLRKDESMTFNEKLDLFLKIPANDILYGGDIIRDPNGTVTASRTVVFFDQVSLYDTNDQVDAFQDQREVTRAQPINEGSLDGPFFTFGTLYFGWELWIILAKEISITVALSLLSVFIISLIFFPHPIAAFILTPVVFCIFVEVIAVMRMANIQINALSAIGLITCLGLVVDYNIHVFLTYFEVEGCATRNEKVEKVLNTMGKSIMFGGFTTFLGVLPLSLNSSLGFRTLFVTFIGITSLGVAHGLIFLPVVLSLIGPLREERQPENGRSVESPTASDEITNDELDPDSNSAHSDAVMN